MSSHKSVITQDETIYNIVTQYPELKELLISLSPRFERLQNPVLFQTVARLTSVAQAAKVGGIYLKEFLYQLNEAIGMEKEYFDNEKSKVQGLRESFLKGFSSEKAETPQWMDHISHWDTLDVRDQAGDPFNIIVENTEKLRHGEGILLIQKFEPLPLLNFMRLQGFDSFIKKQDTDQYYIYLYKTKGDQDA